MTEHLPTVTHVRRSPDDRYVITTEDHLSDIAAARLSQRVASHMDVSAGHVLVLDGGLSLAVVSPTDQRRVPDLLAANTRTWNRNTALSAALIALVEHFERVDAPESDRAAIAAACAAFKVNADPVVQPMGGDGNLSWGREVWPHEDQLAVRPTVDLWRNLALVHQLAANFSGMLEAHVENTGEELDTEDRALADDWTRQLDQIGQHALDNAPEGSLVIALRPDPEPVVPVNEAGPVVAGGSALVSAFMEGYPVVAAVQPATRKLLEDFVAFAAQQLKGRVASRPAGGVIAPGRQYIVGEDGPEVVVPLDRRPMCKGDYRLGTACGNCARCDEARRRGDDKGDQ